MRFDHIASGIVNADQSVMKNALSLCGAQKRQNPQHEVLGDHR
jgi:hypothetical protein